MDSKPRLGCAVIILNGNKVLLGKRAKEPYFGKWIIPGGGVKFLESYKDTAMREVLEETGLTIDNPVFYGIKEIINHPDEHRVVIYLITEYKGDDYKPSSDLSELKFFDEMEIEQLRKEDSITPTVCVILSRAPLRVSFCNQLPAPSESPARNDLQGCRPGSVRGPSHIPSR